MTAPIYLDYNATTPVDPLVVQAMLPYFGTQFGNPSSKRHAYGWAADEAVTVGREQVAELLNAEPDWIHFTGGATEAVNWGIKGYVRANRSKGNHIITVATEHKAVLDTCQALEQEGFVITVLDVDGDGRITGDAVANAIGSETVLVCTMWANNELGVIHPIADILDAAHERNVPVLVDATQAIGKISVDASRVDLLACTAHKFYGPKGVGALSINRSSRRLRLDSLIHGGGQEGGKRAGTLNVPGIVGMGAAAAVALEKLTSEETRMARLRDFLEATIREEGARMRVNGAQGPRLPNTSNMTFHGVDTAKMIGLIPELAVSTGSACSSGLGGPSHVLEAIGSDLKSATIRVSLGRFTTDEEVLEAGQAIGRAAVQFQMLEA